MTIEWGLLIIGIIFLLTAFIDERNGWFFMLMGIVLVGAGAFGLFMKYVVGV